MTKLNDDVEIEWPAEEMTSLDALSDPADEVYYIPAPDNGYVLCPHAKKIFDGMKAAQKARQGTLAAKDAELAALREETKRAEAALHKLVCGKALREAARRAGCAPKFLGAVEAALLADLDLVTEDDAEGKAVAALADGGSIEFAVATFLGSDDGEAFVEPVETMGPVVKAVRSLH